MKTATGTRENVKVIEEFTSGGLKVEVLEYEKLLGLKCFHGTADLLHGTATHPCTSDRTVSEQRKSNDRARCNELFPGKY